MEFANPHLGGLLGQQEEVHPNMAVTRADLCLSLPLRDHEYGCISKKTYQAWTASMGQGPNESDTEDLLQLLINPNDVYSSRSPSASPESNRGISDQPLADAPLPNESRPPDLSPAMIYEALGDTASMEAGALAADACSSQLKNWTPPRMLPEACVMNEISPGLFEKANELSPTEMRREMGVSQPLHPASLALTDEERRLLHQEGVLLHSHLPLTTAEERILKKVRRKIRNKQSAQDSRRRKKDYVDGLESRAAACSAQNQELQKRVQELEMNNGSLLSQLQKLQGFLKKTSTKAAQTSTCLVILLFSLGLLILPRCSCFLGRTQLSQESYKPSGVISRTILTKGEFSDLDEPPGTHQLDWPSPQAAWVQEEEPDIRDGHLPAVGEGLMNTSTPGPPGSSQAEAKEALLAEEKALELAKQMRSSDEM